MYVAFIGFVGRQYLKAIEIMFFDVFLYAGIPIGCVNLPTISSQSDLRKRFVVELNQ